MGDTSYPQMRLKHHCNVLPLFCQEKISQERLFFDLLMKILQKIPEY
jgi:hypothetical protein